MRYRAIPWQMLLVAAALSGATASWAQEPEVPTIPEVDVRLGMMPFADHTYQIIGIEKGWYKEVGINVLPAPQGQVYLEPEMVPAMVAGNVDIGSYAGAVIAAQDNAINDLTFITISDAFYGNAILAAPDSPYKTYQDFRREGLSPQDAVAAAVGQMRGKSFGHDPTPSARGMREIAFEMAGLDMAEVTETVLDDIKNAELALSGRLDFVQPTSGPIILGLQTKGFKSIIRAADLVEVAEPRPGSPVLFSLGLCGQVARKDWVSDAANYETALRAASVMYRVHDLITRQPREALEVHLGFLNPLTGQSFTIDEGLGLYRTIQIFMDFDEARRIFLDTEDPLYYEYFFQTHLDKNKSDGLLMEDHHPDEFVLAKKIYLDLLSHRLDAESAFWRTEQLIDIAQTQGKTLEKAGELLASARRLYEARDYLDASRFARASINWAEYELGASLEASQ